MQPEVGWGRHAARPPLALDRLSREPDGTLLYELPARPTAAKGAEHTVCHITRGLHSAARLAPGYEPKAFAAGAGRSPRMRCATTSRTSSPDRAGSRHLIPVMSKN